VPAGAGEAPNHHSAWTTAEPPARRSVSVAVSVAGCWLSIGSGFERMEPATTTGPTRSPPLRLTVKFASLASRARSEGDPESVMRTRTRPCVVFGTPDRFHTYGEGPALVVRFTHDWPPSSE